MCENIDIRVGDVALWTICAALGILYFLLLNITLNYIYAAVSHMAHTYNVGIRIVPEKNILENDQHEQNMLKTQHTNWRYYMFLSQIEANRMF